MPLDGYAYANDIFIDGEDVYVAGENVKGTNGTCNPVIWKNGEEIVLRHDLYRMSARSVAVANGHVYVAGYGENNFWSPQAVLWVDGDPRLLWEWDDSHGATATSLAISGAGDVYVAGYTNLGPTLWKNGDPTVFTPEWGVANSPPLYVPSDQVSRSVDTNPATRNSGGRSASVFTSGDDVYFAAWHWVMEMGEFLTVPTVWKNGKELMRLGNERNTTYDPATSFMIPRSEYYAPTSIFVDGDDVYVTGQVIRRQFDPACPSSTFMSHAVLWKNGQETLLSRKAYDASGYPLDAISSTSTAHCVKVVGDDVYVVGSQLDRSGRCHAVLWVNGEMLDLGQGIDSDAFSVLVKGKHNDPSPRR
jgi:hypothetical protein